MKIIDNINSLLGDDLKETIKKGDKLKIAASCFSIYAYEALKDEFEKIESLEFIFTEASFIPSKVTDKIKKEQKQFHIPNKEKYLYGNKFEIQLKNKLTQKAIAKDSVIWNKLFNFQRDAATGIINKLENRMVIADVTATGDDNVLTSQSNDVSYRKEQLRRLKDEVIELEDLKTGVNITDLGLNDFRMDKFFGDTMKNFEPPMNTDKHKFLYKEEISLKNKKTICENPCQSVVQPINFPSSAKFAKIIPKTRFATSAKMKKIFTEQVDKIIWSFKFSSDTINLSSTGNLKEFQVFTIRLKNCELSKDILPLIDKAIPSPIIFQLEFDGKIKYSACFAKKTDNYFETEWIANSADKIDLPIVLNLEELYNSLLKDIINLQNIENKPIIELVNRAIDAKKLNRELSKLENSLKREKQFNRKVEINSKIKKLKERLKIKDKLWIS